MLLPVYEVAPSAAPAERIEQIARILFPGQDREVRERGSNVEIRTRTGSVVVDAARGGTWAADTSRLWRVQDVPREVPGLLGAQEAIPVARNLLQAAALAPALAGPFHLLPEETTGTRMVVRENGGPRRSFFSDTTVFSQVGIDVHDWAPELGELSIVGGGGRFAAIFGEGGRPIGARGVWRQPTRDPELHEVIPQDRADERFRELTQAATVVDFHSSIAYYAAPAFAEQTFLYPVYVYDGTIEADGRRMPMRSILIPATDVGEMPVLGAPQPVRRDGARPHGRPLPGDLRLEPGRPLPPGVRINRRVARDLHIDPGQILVPAVPGGPLVINPEISLELLHELGNLLGFYSAGTSWIGALGGLGGSQSNAQGFVDGLAALGWNIRFNWGNENAWETDWHECDDEWVDSADFVFYTGHANGDGWMLAQPNDGSLTFSETAGPPDIWGANNLEWAVVAACGPLQDDLVIPGGGDVLDRWQNAFDGLHLLMGYSNVTHDTTEEGKRLVRYASEGATLMQAWFRTGQEIQAGMSNVWAGAYYVADATGCTAGDHLWGIGSVCHDVTAPTLLGCCWVPC